MYTIGVGSKNPAKLKAVKRLFEPLGSAVISVDVPSGVSAMPQSDRETRQGAVNRSLAVLRESQAEIGIGLEGGVMDIDGEMYLCNWGALSDRNGCTITAAGARIKLPEALRDGILSGLELGDVIDRYAAKKDVRKAEGTVGILTNGRLPRDDMFYHIVTLLWGSYEFQLK